MAEYIDGGVAMAYCNDVAHQKVTRDGDGRRSKLTTENSASILARVIASRVLQGVQTRHPWGTPSCVDGEQQGKLLGAHDPMLMLGIHSLVSTLRCSCIPSCKKT